jgi:transcriptional regulator with XRE-family HTH domain
MPARKAGPARGRGPREPRYIGPAGITPGQVAEARKDLGRQLAAWRDAAGLTQVELARRTCNSRSAVANVEIGRQNIPRRFWQSADSECGAAGALVAAFDQVDALVRDFNTQAAQVREQQRAARYAPPAPAVAPQVPVVADGCGVGGWPLDRAGDPGVAGVLRMSVRVFADYLGVATATVSWWENRDAPLS